MRPLVFATILATLAAFPVAAQAPANTKAAPKAPLPAPSAAPSENEMRSRQLLVDALSDKNPDTRKAAVVALGLVDRKSTRLNSSH